MEVRDVGWTGFVLPHTLKFQGKIFNVWELVPRKQNIMPEMIRQFMDVCTFNPLWGSADVIFMS
jgi:hypothetical protein